MFDRLKSALRGLHVPSDRERELAYLNAAVSLSDLERRQREVDRGLFRNAFTADTWPQGQGKLPPALRHHLAGVHPVLRIERALDGTHHGPGGPVFRRHQRQLAEPHPMFARDGAAQAQGAFGHARRQRLGHRRFGRVPLAHQKDGVEVAVADMARMGPGTGLAAISARVSSTASARAEIGTQTSVTIALQPGRLARMAR